MGTAKEISVREAADNEAVLEELIRENRRFILSSAYRVTGRFITEQDDAWAIALYAFHEAVRTYDAAKGDFHAFAALVIRRRLTDEMRIEMRHAQEVPTAPEVMDGDVEDETAETAFSMEVRKKEAEISTLQSDGAGADNPARDEIEAMQQVLGGYGFSFYDLTGCSPKADKTKRACAAVVDTLLRDQALLQKTRDSKSLPVKELIKESGVPRKIIDRHRKYIIAATEILSGEYPVLASYLQTIREMGAKR